MRKILLASFPPHNELIKNILKSKLSSDLFNKFEIKTLPVMDLSITILNKLIEIIEDVEIVVIYGAPITDKVVSSAKKLKLIVSTRGGPVNIDVVAAEKEGILVTNAPGHNAEAVADHAFGLLLAEIRNIVRGHNAVKKGLWTSKNYFRFNSFEMKGKTLGIVGFGNIGPLIAKRASGFGLNILVYDPYVSEQLILSEGGKKVDFDFLLKNSDFITVHVRLTRETYHMFGKEQFELMKPTAYFINDSRGPVVDEQSLYEVLKNKKIAGAALDVFEVEPIEADNPLLTLENITLTPHIAHVGTSYLRGATMAVEEIERYLKGEKLKYPIKAAAYKFEREMYSKIFKGRRLK